MALSQTILNNLKISDMISNWLRYITVSQDSDIIWATLFKQACVYIYKQMHMKHQLN